TSYYAFVPQFTGGVYVAAGDVNGDGHCDIIAGADRGGGPEVKVFSGADGTLLFDFFAMPAGFSGGVRVAAADLTGDGRAEVITAAGPGGGPLVAVFDGATGVEREAFYALTPRFAGGVYATAGDLTGNGQADIICGAGAGGGPQVTIFSPDGTLLD